LQQFDDPLSDPDRRLRRLLARLQRQRAGIKQELKIDIGGKVELTAAELAERNDREAGDRRAGSALPDRRGQRLFKRFVGKVGQAGDQLFQREQAGEVADRQRKRNPAAPPAA